MSLPTFPARRQKARRWLLVSWTIMASIWVAWWLSGLHWPPGTAFMAAGLAILPLLLVLPGIARGSRFVCAGSTLLLTPYAGWGITEIVANPSARLFAGASVLATMTCFFCLIYWLRILRAA